MIKTLSVYGLSFAKGIGMTMFTWIFAGTLSMCIGIIAGILSCNQLSTYCSRILIKAYTFVAKGIPAYVQILIAYFVIPNFLGIAIPALWSVIAALAFCSGAYVAEIVRSGMNTVAVGQWDACKVLGYSTYNMIFRIIGPQALRATLPQLSGELEQLLKSTSLLATVGVTEITRVGMNIVSRELNPLPVYALVALIYLVLTALFHIAVYFLEKNMRRCYVTR